MTREELWAQVHATRDRFYAGDPLYQANTPPPEPEPAPACPHCEDHGEVTVPLGRDEFGNWDTTTRPCSCPAGDVVAVNLATARAARRKGPST